MEALYLQAFGGKMFELLHGFIPSLMETSYLREAFFIGDLYMWHDHLLFYVCVDLVVGGYCFFTSP
jgi:hypothetical protein